MTLKEVMEALEKNGDPKMREMYIKHGAGENQFGVKNGILRDLAKQIKKDHALALELWGTENTDARQLSTLIMDPKALTREEIDRMVHEISYFGVADWFNTNILKNRKDAQEWREAWKDSAHEFVGRIGWSLANQYAKSDPGEKELDRLLKQIEAEMKNAPVKKQETMNFCLIEIGMRYPELRDRCIKIGEKLGVLKDYPTPKGCVSPYAPIAIPEMVKRA